MLQLDPVERSRQNGLCVNLGTVDTRNITYDKSRKNNECITKVSRERFKIHYVVWPLT